VGVEAGMRAGRTEVLNVAGSDADSRVNAIVINSLGRNGGGDEIRWMKKTCD
jgi:hypothetical protein